MRGESPPVAFLSLGGLVIVEGLSRGSGRPHTNSTMISRATFFLATMSLCALPGIAQKAPLKWGDIPHEHLEMTSYPADTSASAVILFDYADVYHSQAGDLVLDRHRRIKILDDAGLDYGTVLLTYRAENRTSGIRRVRGQTFNVDESGKVTRTRLDSKSVFDDKLSDDYGQIRFTLPQLKAGSVIEYSYRQQFDVPYMVPTWTFQHGEPVLYSEYRVNIPDVFRYVTATRGVILGRPEVTRTTGPRGNGQLYRWVMTDIAALREEPFMTTPADFRAAIDFQPSGFRTSLGNFQSIITTWDDLAERLMNLDLFGKQISRHRAVSELAHTLTFGMDPPQQVAAIYDYVSQNIEWNGSLGGYVPDRQLPDVLNTKTGTAAEINMLLLAMLVEAGIEADPVLISTRGHGQMQDLYPITSQFNALIVRLRVDGRTIFADASSRLRPIDLLPSRALNNRGWMVRESNPQWVSIRPTDKYRRTVVVTGEVDEQGNLAGEVAASHYGYSAVSQRDFLQENDLEDYFRRRVFQDLGDFQLFDLEVESQDDLTAPLVLKARFEIPMYAMAAGKMLYMNTQLFERVAANPLRLPERSFPVDMTYPRETVYSARFILPEGYQIIDRPRDVNLTTPRRGASFGRMVQQQENVLIVQSRFTIDQVVFQPSEYGAIRQVYAEVASAHNDQVVLRQRANEVSAAGTDVEVGGDSR